MEKIITALAIFGGLTLLVMAVAVIAAACDGRDQNKTRVMFRTLYRFTGKHLDRK